MPTIVYRFINKATLPVKSIRAGLGQPVVCWADVLWRCALSLGIIDRGGPIVWTISKTFLKDAKRRNEFWLIAPHYFQGGTSRPERTRTGLRDPERQPLPGIWGHSQPTQKNAPVAAGTAVSPIMRKGHPYSFVISILRVSVFASVRGMVTRSTPLSKLAWMPLVSTSSGRVSIRWKEP